MTVRRRTLTPQQLACLRAYALTGDRRRAAELMGVAEGTHRNHLWQAFARLGVNTAIEAFTVLGWLKVRQ